MCRYLVAEVHGTRRELLLLDAYGRLHLVALTCLTGPRPPLPARGSVLHGPLPVPGFQWLRDERGGRQVGFTLLDAACQRAPVLQRWQVAEPPRAQPAGRIARRPRGARIPAGADLRAAAHRREPDRSAASAVSGLALQRTPPPTPTDERPDAPSLFHLPPSRKPLP